MVAHNPQTSGGTGTGIYEPRTLSYISTGQVGIMLLSQIGRDSQALIKEVKKKIFLALT